MPNMFYVTATKAEWGAYNLGFREGLEQAAQIAREGCLVPPDGGSPSADEVEMCDRIAAAILQHKNPA